MKKLWTVIFFGALLSVVLTGCIFRSPDELYQLPARSAGFEKLNDKIDQVKRELEMEYGVTVEPAVIYSGDNITSIQLQDLDGDGEQETAVTFLRVPGADMSLRIYFFTLQPDGSYEVTCVIEGSGAAIYAVDYAEISGGGKKELVVSWQTSTSVYQLGVYSLDSVERGDSTLHGGESLSGAIGEPEATELMLTTYSGYNLLDINQDNRTELAVVRLDSAGGNSTVEVYGWRNGAFVSMGTARLSAGVTALSRVRANYVTGSVRALYITGTLMDGSLVTDIVAWRSEELVNLTMNPETGVSYETIRGYGSSMGPSDVNDDTILEMPRPHLLPSYTEGVSNDFWLIDWSQYDINGKASFVFTTYHNTQDSWFFEIPDAWVDQITIGRDDSVSGERAVIFYRWNGADEEPTPFLAIYKMTGTNRTVRAARGDRFILSEDDSTIYAASFLDQRWDCGLDEVDVLNRFHRILTGWTAE